MHTSIPVGISLPQDIITKIDAQRDDISRSRWVLRLLERVYTSRQETGESDEGSFESRIGTQQSNEPRSL